MNAPLAMLHLMQHFRCEIAPRAARAVRSTRGRGGSRFGGGWVQKRTDSVAGDFGQKCLAAAALTLCTGYFARNAAQEVARG